MSWMIWTCLNKRLLLKTPTNPLSPSHPLVSIHLAKLLEIMRRYVYFTLDGYFMDIPSIQDSADRLFGEEYINTPKLLVFLPLLLSLFNVCHTPGCGSCVDREMVTYHWRGACLYVKCVCNNHHSFEVCYLCLYNSWIFINLCGGEISYFFMGL